MQCYDTTNRLAFFCNSFCTVIWYFFFSPFYWKWIRSQFIICGLNFNSILKKWKETKRNKNQQKKRKRKYYDWCGALEGGKLLPFITFLTDFIQLTQLFNCVVLQQWWFLFFSHINTLFFCENGESSPFASLYLGRYHSNYTLITTLQMDLASMVIDKKGNNPLKSRRQCMNKTRSHEIDVSQPQSISPSRTLLALSVVWSSHSCPVCVCVCWIQRVIVRHPILVDVLLLFFSFPSIR